MKDSSKKLNNLLSNLAKKINAATGEKVGLHRTGLNICLGYEISIEDLKDLTDQISPICGASAELSVFVSNTEELFLEITYPGTVSEVLKALEDRGNN